MTMVLPCRLITRQRSHMGFTEARTFISSTLSVGDSTAGEVVGRQLHLHLVAEHRARKGLGDLAFDLDLVVLLRQLPRRNRASSARLSGHRKTRLAPRLVMVANPL